MAKKPKLPILYVVLSGSSDEFPRFTILAPQDRHWNGQEFGPTGVLYANHNAAAVDAQNILRSHFDGEPQRYIVPLCIEVYSHAGPVNVADGHQCLATAQPFPQGAGKETIRVVGIFRACCVGIQKFHWSS